jgi:hypothetical protein
VRARDVLRRIRVVHPDLADHLQASVSTGTPCRYDPAGSVVLATHPQLAAVDGEGVHHEQVEGDDDQ